MTDSDRPTFCIACGTGLPAAAHFCPNCGKEARAQAGGTLPAHEEPAAERRPVVVLFADLSGYTRLSSALDPEEVHRLLGRYFEAVDAAVRHYGGAIDKHLGDAVMGVFGAPIAHGNDAERAVRAAFDIHRVMEQVSAEFGRPLQAHVGIASGEVVAAGIGSGAQREYTMTGNAVNLAARLDEMAKGGETLISGEVHGAIGHLVEAESRGAVTLRGLERSVAVWKLLALREQQRATAPLVGRATECRQFTALAGTTRDSGRGLAILLRGEAGIGKTRLVEEFITIAEGMGFSCHRGLVLDFGVARGQDAIGTVVATLLGAPPQANAGARRVALDAAVGAALLPRDAVLFAAELLNAPLDEDQRLIFDAMDNAARVSGKAAVLATLLRNSADRKPRLLIVEDVHWADAALLELLAAASRAAAGCAAIVVTTSRNDGDPLDSAWQNLASPAQVATMDLAPLAADDALALAGDFARANVRLVNACISRAGGNPLFLVQLLHSARENEAASVPASIQSLVLARMDRLTAGDKEAMQVASVIGQRFSLPLLRHLLGDRGYRCKALIAHQLVREEGDDYLFAHALIRDGAYSSLLNSRKRELHGNAARWFAGRDPVLHAEHLDRATDPQAAAAYCEAAKVEAAGFRFDSALTLARRGDALASENQTRYALKLLQGEVLHDIARAAESVAALREALDLAPDESGRCHALIGLAAGNRILGKGPPALAALAQAQPLAERLGLHRELSKIHWLRGNLHFARGEIAACLTEHQSALSAAGAAGDAESEANALSGIGDAEYARGRMATAGRYFERCVAICRERGLVRTGIANRAMLAHVNFYLNRVEPYLADTRAAADDAARIGYAYGEMFAWQSIATILCHQGEYAAAEDPLERVLAMSRALGSRRYEMSLVLYRGEILCGLGQREEARRHLHQALAMSRKIGMGFLGAAILGQLALASDDGEQRRHALQEGRALLDRGCVGHNYFWFYRDAIDTCLNHHEWDEADGYAAALECYMLPEPLPWAEFLVARGRALAAFGRGRRSSELRAELERLTEVARCTPMLAALAALERALASA